MRSDQTGFFWEDQERVSVWANKAKGIKTTGLERIRSMPPVPETGWTMPTEFPNLAGAKILGVDTETYDPTLLTSGPSTKTGGHLVGVSVATEDQAWYFPMRHTLGENMNPEQVIAWLRDTLALPMPKVFHNALYDLEWLLTEGIVVNGKIYDTGFAEPLIDEESRAGYSLDAIAEKYLGIGKTDELLYDWCYRAYGGSQGRRQASNIYRAPSSLVGPYAEQDARLLIPIFDKQMQILKDQNLLELYDLEVRLIPPLLFMRQCGVPVNVPGAEKAYEWLTTKINEANKLIQGINIYAAEDIADFCDKHKIEYPHTDKGNPSFTSAWLESHTDPRIRAITDARRYTKARDTFIKGYILDKHINGRLYCQFHPLRGDENGTVSGRFSSSNPNLQNIPSRDEEIGPMIRSLFIPEPDCQWLRYDWSQIEYRLLTHYAMGDKADEARRMYREDPTTDFHRMTAEITGIDRKQAKNINFGLVYGMSENTMAGHLGRPLEEVQPMFETYHGRMPFVKYTYDFVSNRAANRGFITTILGRRRRFNMFQSAKWGEDGFFTEEVARAKFKRVRRAFTHKALNSLLQGGAADLMKKALVMIWEEGLIDEQFMCYLLVHDEFDFNYPEGFLERAVRVHDIMEHCLELKIPIVAEVEVGANWGALNSFAL